MKWYTHWVGDENIFVPFNDFSSDFNYIHSLLFVIIIVHLRMQWKHCAFSFFHKFCFLASSFLFVNCLWEHCRIIYTKCAFSFLFIWCLWIRCWIIYIKCALCLWKLVVVFWWKSLHLKKQCAGTFGLKGH